MSESYLLAGRFGAATRLSPKALRLYAEQGLLVPAYTDPTTGYRYYAPEQAARARLIARLRRLGLSVARVAQLVELDAQSRLIELRSWLDAQNERLSEQTELVEAIARQTDGGDADLISAIAVREVAACKLISCQRQLDIEALDAFLATAQAEIRGYLRHCGIASDGAMTVHFHETVSRDSEGLVEVAIAYEGGIEPVDDLRIRLQAARREVFLPVPAACENFPLILRVYDAIETWLDARTDINSSGSPYEIYPGSNGASFDVAYPIMFPS
ncbi:MULTISPECIES: MerR family transcriptional regulator [unclassified Ensifer]|uniref:MerR family transcriptional regulator n=1 Tax=unclassified Ensifer TaxID=2633371 RepID=UPI00046CCCA4|nr:MULTISPECIES: MerR family transcriptional regulator [unclassified Ensifer]KQW63261.1 MerR family transcriptional regulator [Ensifer sp. Root1252]KQW85276.1 MerR family transcriptional regulator [Ensifer sp. Root127]KRC84082.1 MerR family transcriptional regulator [Ensifer sp. Root231]KRD04436.1 MerR family transcriptional regulator [Ensifer sp. Root258]MBD9485708.1 MerR family transcriptional regulator [Ensifer sp. ENS11]